jgi:hypothetical protein
MLLLEAVFCVVYSGYRVGGLLDVTNMHPACHGVQLYVSDCHAAEFRCHAAEFLLFCHSLQILLTCFRYSGVFLCAF